MNTLTQKLCFRQSVVLYSQRNSVFSAIRKFGISRATIYRWRKIYDGTLDSLAATTLFLCVPLLGNPLNNTFQTT